jgi:ribosomal protein S18 acetylase RimI-like enzyme
MLDIIIRPLQSQDDELCRQCHVIEALCYPESEALNIFSEAIKPNMHIFFAQEPASHTKKESELCHGYVLFQKTSLMISICKIVILPHYRRLGVGRQLLKSVVEFATQKGIGVCSLNVEETNLAALALYKSEGFLECDRRPDFYAIGRHGLHMEKDIG